MAEDTKDVKETVVTNDASNTTPVEPVIEGSIEVVESESRSIPYSRFKEVNDTKKDLEKRLKQMETTIEQRASDVARQYQTYYESEIAKLQRVKSEEVNPYLEPEPTQVFNEKFGGVSKEVDILKNELHALKSERELEKLNTQISKLKEIYPSLDEEHVLAIKKICPDKDISECAELSHTKFENEIKSRWSKLVEQKKQAAKKPVFETDGRINLKPEEKPKSFRDASKALKAHMSKFD
jgi:hypothetical protein